jgi:hypothetical protein
MIVTKNIKINDVEVSTVKLGNRNIFIARDDMLEGGTKQRAASPFMQYRMSLGDHTFAYPTPFCGYAQIVIAYTAKLLGAKAVIFHDRFKDDPSGRHYLTNIAESYGAEIFMCETHDEAMERCKEYCKGKEGVLNIPLGFDDEVYRAMFYDALKKQWDLITAKHNVTELWLPVGSGTLTRTFSKIVPKHIPIKCVTVNILSEEHEMIANVKNNPKVENFYSAPEKFVDKAENTPPVPSNIYYDAKIFRFVEKYAKNGALWWNVAK